MMWILPKTPSVEGQYGPLKTWAGLTPPDGHYWWPDYLSRETFDRYEGFVLPTIKRGTVASYIANKEAYEAWKAAHPDPEPEPTEAQLLGQEITDLQLADIEQGQYATGLDLRIREMEGSTHV